MGVSIKQKPDGKAIVYVHYRGRRLNRTCPNDEVAQELAKMFIKQLAMDPDAIFRKPEPMKPTFRQLSKEWLARIAKDTKETTYNRYNQLSRDYVLPAIGSKRVDEIKKHQIADALEKAHDDGKSVSTLGLIRTCFSGPLGIAAFREYIPANPADGILKQLGYSRKKERSQKAHKTNSLPRNRSTLSWSHAMNNIQNIYRFFSSYL